MTFREQLKSHRQRLRRSQAQAASLFPDLSPRVWSDWECARPKVPPLWVQHLVIAHLKKSAPLSSEEGQFDKRGRPSQGD